MLGHVTQELPVRLAHLAHGRAVPAHLAGGGHEVVGDDVHKGGLAGAVGAEDAVDAGRQLRRHVRQRRTRGPAVGVGDVGEGEHGGGASFVGGGTEHFLLSVRM